MVDARTLFLKNNKIVSIICLLLQIEIKLTVVVWRF